MYEWMSEVVQYSTTIDIHVGRCGPLMREVAELLEIKLLLNG